MASTAHGRWGLLSHDSRKSQSKEFARSDPPSPLLSSEESESLSLAAARCWAMIILGAFFKCSLSSSLDHNIDNISMSQHHTENSLYVEKKNAIIHRIKNNLIEKQIIYLPRGEGRGGEGREKGKGHSFQPFLPSPPEGLILRPPPHLFNCYAA